MSDRNRYAEQVSVTTFGIDMRDPIVKGCKMGDTNIDAFQKYCTNEMREAVQYGQEDLDKTLRQGQYKLDATILSGKNQLSELPIAAFQKQLVRIDKKCDTRISEMQLTKLPGDNEYYRLSFIRADEE